MKTALRLAIAVLAMASLHLSAQTLDLKTYAGLAIKGSIGRFYSIEYVTDLALTNDPSAWRCLEYLQLPVNPYLWMDKSAPATGQRFYRAVITAPAKMVFIPPGTFRMGSPNDEDGRDADEVQRVVTITKGYWMGKYEVTQGEYLAVMGGNPSQFSTNNGFADGLSRPVEKVSWEDATAYCAALTERERLAGRIRTNSIYRLPTEAEWEYACRAWISTRFSYGDDPNYTELTAYAWYPVNSDDQTHPVGQKLLNPWGLYDMHGNVWEWCQDWYGEYGVTAIDPQGAPTGTYHVIRGGGWIGYEQNNDIRYCRSAFRAFGNPGYEYRGIGFRVVLAPGQP